MKKTFGRQLRENAEASPDKAARGTSGAWSIVLSAPGFQRGLIKEYWLTAKHRFPANAPSADDIVELRKVVYDAGGPAHQDPEEAVLGTKMWRWKPSVDAPEPLVPGPSAEENLLLDNEAPPHLMTDKPGRNDPCVCGSGKKYKKCCIDKPRVIGACLVPMSEKWMANGAAAVCGAQAAIALFCKKCGKQYPSCSDESHKKTAQQMINGHVLRVHPETVPVNIFDTWIKDPVWIAMHEEQRAKHPELWARLFEYIAERHRHCASNSPN